MFNRKLIFSALICGALCLASSVAFAQDYLPRDNGLATYHTAPRYRDSESHPLRIIAYILHPIGWVLREGIARPLSYFASSSETTRSVMGFREPFDYREPECFSADENVPDCHALSPFGTAGAGDAGSDEGEGEASAQSAVAAGQQVYLPDVNFDFNGRGLTPLGKGKVHQIADLLKSSSGLKIVLEGNTDSVGGDAYNEKLGLDRAEAVKQELVSLGVSPDKLATVSFGKNKPLYAQDDDWAHAVNRRVQVSVQ